MENTMELYSQRLNRIEKAIKLERPDKIPVVALADTFCALHTGTKLSAFATSVGLSGKSILKTFCDYNGFDATEVAYAFPKYFAFSILTKIKLPGRELPENTCWQMDEQGYMTVEDYDYIINNGWNKFVKKINKERLGFSKFELLKGQFAASKPAKNFKKAGIPVLSDVSIAMPIEILITSRTFPKFVQDLHRIPDKVESVMNIALADIIDGTLKWMQFAKPFSVILYNVYGGSEFLSPKLWKRFVWPYLKKSIETLVEKGVYVNLHLDSNWDRDLEYFNELPKGKCIWASDHKTDLYKLKKIIGDRMCIKGDVPSSMLAFGTPDEVYGYCKKLITDIGPSGFILAPGCSLPMNAKPENVKAMLSAADDSRK